MLTDCRALRNRLVPPRLGIPHDVLKLLPTEIIILIGSSLAFGWCIGRVCHISFWDGAREWRRLDLDLKLWGALLALSLLSGAWSVGRAVSHVAGRVWRWARLYEPGGG